MLRHLGYSGATQSIDACTTRVCRPEEATPDRIRSMIRDNLRDLARILDHNSRTGIGFYRISSRIIPFASHPGNSLPWWDEFADQLDRLGSFARLHGLRLEMHPGHHCLLNSPSPETVALSILELGWHVHFFDAMRLEPSNKLVLRIGGTFGDKSAAFDRFAQVINGLPEAWRARLAIESDGVQFTLIEVLEAADRTALPVALGGTATSALPGHRFPDGRSIARCFSTWKAREGPAIVHLGGASSMMGPSDRATDRVDLGDLATLASLTPPMVPFDCLIDTERGEQALLEIRGRLMAGEPGGPASRPGVAQSPIS